MKKSISLKSISFLFLFAFMLMGRSPFAEQLSGDTPIVKLVGPHVVCISSDSEWTDSGYIVIDRDWQLSDMTVTKESCSNAFLQNKPGISKFRYRVCNKSVHCAVSEWRYIIRKDTNDNSPCLLTDSIKDTCYKLAPASIINLQYEALKAIKLFPNPASQAIHIQAYDIGLEGTLIVRITDMQGKCLVSESFGNNAFGMDARINTSAMPNGMYIIEQGKGQAMESRMIAVQH